MATLRMRLGRRIRQLRKAADLTQQELSDRARMDWKYLGSVERGERNITIDNVERIVHALRVEPYELLLFSSKESAPPRKIDDDVIFNLVRHTDASIRPFLIGLVEHVLRWASEKKRK